MDDIADHGIRFGRIAAMLPVKDMGKAHDFYVNVLGFRKPSKTAIRSAS